MADIWTNLNTFKLGDVEAANIQRQTDPIHIEELNRSALEDTKLINDATMRSGSPMPGTGAIKTQTITYTDGDAATQYKDWFTVEKGEVWQLIAASATMTGGTVGCSLLTGATAVVNITTGPSDYVLIAQESSSGQPIFSPLLYGADIFFDENTFPIMQVYSMGAGETCKLFGHFIRIR
jgi:hypothetical protein